MPINKLYGGSIALTAKALDLRSEKQGLIQSNVANMQTPGYKVQEFSFEEVMKSMMTESGNLKRTHEKHMKLDPLEIEKNLNIQEGNRPVDLDEEMLKLSENQLMYQVSAQIMTKKFEGLRFVIDEGGK